MCSNALVTRYFLFRNVDFETGLNGLELRGADFIRYYRAPQQSVIRKIGVHPILVKSCVSEQELDKRAGLTGWSRTKWAERMSLESY